MTDMEYTIRAAEAAGYQWATMKTVDEKVVCIKDDPNDLTGYEGWSPLESDCDALALAARMGIVVQDTDAGAIATCIDIPGTQGRGHVVGGDRQAARRFAIVQCAASAQEAAA